MEKLKRVCFICGKEKSDGIILKDKMICKSCEKKIVSLEPGNDFYEYYKNKIKSLYKGDSYIRKQIGE